MIMMTATRAMKLSLPVTRGGDDSAIAGNGLRLRSPWGAVDDGHQPIAIRV